MMAWWRFRAIRPPKWSRRQCSAKLTSRRSASASKPARTPCRSTAFTKACDRIEQRACVAARLAARHHAVAGTLIQAGRTSKVQGRQIGFLGALGEVGAADPAQQEAQMRHIFATQATEEVAFDFIDCRLALNKKLASGRRRRDQDRTLVELPGLPFDQPPGFQYSNVLAHRLSGDHGPASQTRRRHGFEVGNQVEDHVLAGSNTEGLQAFVEFAMNQLLDLLNIEEGATANGHQVFLVDGDYAEYPNVGTANLRGKLPVIISY
ncbi:hypothetical protein PSAC2689_10127 [Paraburkholderia sacchari]